MLVQDFGPDCKIPTTLGWFTMKLCIDIGMKLPDFGDSSNNHLVDFFLLVKTTGWIALTFGTDIHGAQWMNPTNSGAPFLFGSSG